jgi:hypothetical protein
MAGRDCGQARASHPARWPAPVYYSGLAKTHLQHLLTGVALNVVWLGEWWRGTPLANTSCSSFAVLREAAISCDFADELATRTKAGEGCSVGSAFSALP